MKLREARRRLPIVESPPPGRGRRVLPAPRGAVQRPGPAVWEFTLACDQRCQARGPRAGSARPDARSTDKHMTCFNARNDTGTCVQMCDAGDCLDADDGVLQPCPPRFDLMNPERPQDEHSIPVASGGVGAP